MKFLSVILFWMLPFFATIEITDEIETAFKNGNAEAIAKYFDQSVDLKIVNQEDIFSKPQATSILKDFFTKNQVRSFGIGHIGYSKNGDKFAIGSLVTITGRFKTYFLLKKDGEKFYIKQLRIETDSD